MQSLTQCTLNTIQILLTCFELTTFKLHIDLQYFLHQLQISHFWLLLRWFVAITMSNVVKLEHMKSYVMCSVSDLYQKTAH